MTPPNYMTILRTGAREKWASLSEYLKDIKQTFSRWYKQAAPLPQVRLRDREQSLSKGARIQELVAKEQKRTFELDPVDRLLYRTRCFTSSGVIGIERVRFQVLPARFEAHFHCWHEKRLKPVTGLTGVHSLKRLAADSPEDAVCLSPLHFPCRRWPGRKIRYRRCTSSCDQLLGRLQGANPSD